MTQESAEQRKGYAKNKAKKYYEKLGATIINSDNEIICFTANFTTHENKVRVVVDEIKEDDFKCLEKINVHANQSKHIFCQLYKEREPRIIEIINEQKVKVLYDPTFSSLRSEILSIPKYLDVVSRKP